MKNSVRLLVLLAVIVGMSAAAAPAKADESEGGAVFVQTNNPAGNAIDAFTRNNDGTLAFHTSYPTGGLGGREAGSGSDPLATQGSLALAADRQLLVAVNAGSNTISVFHVSGPRLHLIQVLSSGGLFPTGLAIHDDLVYALNAGGAGAVSGFRIEDGALEPIDGSTRTLGLANATPPFFLSSPAEAGFTPDGRHLIVTTKINGTVDVFSVGEEGRLSATSVNSAAAPVPFAWIFDRAGELVLNFAGSSSLQTFSVNDNNTITPVGAPVSDTRAALCWVTPAAGFVYGSNTGTGDVSQFKVLDDGSVVLVDAIAASGIGGATDSAAAGGFLYVQSGSSATVHAFRIGRGGELTRVQIATVPGGGSQEGIVAD